jgi:hypothetical protein
MHPAFLSQSQVIAICDMRQVVVSHYATFNLLTGFAFSSHSPSLPVLPQVPNILWLVCLIDAGQHQKVHQPACAFTGTAQRRHERA